MFASAASKMSGNGSYKLRNSEDGLAWAGTGKMEVITPPSFATEIRGSGKHLSGSKDHSLGIEESAPGLTSHYAVR